MDPLHITEFASERYFEKLRQLNDSAEQTEDVAGAVATHSLSSAVSLHQHHFTLPLGQSRQRHSNDESSYIKPSDQRKRTLGHDLTSLRSQRRPSLAGSLGNLRTRLSSQKSLATLRPHQDVCVEESHIRYIPGWNDLFQALPLELQAYILATLPIHDILNLRLVSRSYHALVSLNEAPIARYHVAHSLPSYTLRLYPQPKTSEINLHYICGIWHRLHVAAKLATMIAEQATKEIFLRTTPVQRREFAPQHQRMQQRLMPLLFTVFHFFETYRARHAEHLLAGGVSLAHWPHTINPIEREVMQAYDDQTLLRVHQVFPLIMSCFSRRLRPPSYVGTVEKTLKGYLRDKPADEVYATILAIGGLRQAQRFWETKGYNTRRASVDTWFSYVARPVGEPATGRKLSLMDRMKRKHKECKKLSGIAEEVPTEAIPHDATSCQEWFCVKPTCAPISVVATRTALHSSLTAGPPMQPLSREALQRLIPDLQPLTSIWCLTAEAMILDRKIVARPQDIKRNTQVLLELIRDDGTDGIDDWIHANRLQRSATMASDTTSHSGHLSD